MGSPCPSKRRMCGCGIGAAGNDAAAPMGPIPDGFGRIFLSEISISTVHHADIWVRACHVDSMWPEHVASSAFYF